MDVIKDFGDKAMTTAKVVGEKTLDLVEIGRLKLQVSRLENEIRRLKTKIGNAFYHAYSERADLNEGEIIAICEEIKGKYSEIEELKSKIEEI
ncbi:MAG: hypothetical protein ACOXZT_04220 [Tissierellaceae bacterium]|jgi:hypothetical protein|nr:hypothetical protein [Tissierellia bacterium]